MRYDMPPKRNKKPRSPRQPTPANNHRQPTPANNRRLSSPANSPRQSSPANNPRQPLAAQPSVEELEPQDPPVDYWNVIACIVGLFAVWIRCKLISWLGFIPFAVSLTNMKNPQTDLKLLSLGFLFLITALLTNYFVPERDRQS